VLSKNAEIGVGMIFGFSLYAVFLQVVLVAYFKRALRKTRKTKLPEDSKVFYNPY